ncbi:ATP-binding protein [Microbulbifer sp. THAF38]|uniref:sensor histidine kinase n=1 Tax=Microbulbifer sp. THAF38 TaxID=2587856 RepID=UPI001268AF3B|nr:ATP-binding protein [Microbulbifer sp. THAF38]QFT55991.1 Phytochrome-like protein cph1 [Microbulbifer sp. THAF38]
MDKKPSKLRYFWTALILGLCFLFVANSYHTYLNLNELGENAARSGKTKSILQLASDTYFAVHTAELRLREFKQNESSSSLEQYENAVARASELVTKLRNEETEIPEQAIRFEELERLLNRHYSAIGAAVTDHTPGTSSNAQDNQETIELNAAQDTREARNLAQTMEASHDSLEMLSELIATIEEEEFKHIQSLMDDSTLRRQEVTRAVLFANCLGIGLILVIAMLTSRSMRQQSEYAKQLEQRVAERTQELAERTQELELYSQELTRSNRELQNFAFVASHDLQEPLRKIRAFGDRLTDRYSEKLGDGKDYVMRMQSAAKRMSKLIEDLLAFSRTSRRTTPFETVDLNLVVEEVLDDLQIKREETNAEIEVQPLPVVQADPMQMSQLFLNLIGNALKFIKPDNTPIIRVECEKAEISHADITLPGYRITVSDNGIGFDEQYVEKVFSAFQRLHGRNEYEGTGIGLAICRRIMERHCGEIDASSTPGVGTTFELLIPETPPVQVEYNDSEPRLLDTGSTVVTEP